MAKSTHGQRIIKIGSESVSDHKIFVGDSGFFLDLVFDFTVTDATSRSFDVEKPGGTNVTWSTITIPDANTLRYVMEVGDIDEAGVYRVQPKFTLLTPETSTVIGTVPPVSFDVDPAITVV